MPLYGPKPTNGDDSSLIYAGIIEKVKKRLELTISTMKKNSNPDNGFMACIYSLKLLAEGAESDAYEAIHKDQVKQWKDLYFQWFEENSKIPNEFRNEMIQIANENFDYLIKMGSGLPEDFW